MTRPFLGDRSHWLPPALALTTGMIDVIGWLTLNHFYAANITGDLTQSASYLLPEADVHLLQILALPTFVVGLVASYFAVRALAGNHGRIVRVLFVTRTMLLVLAASIAGAFGSFPLPLLHRPLWLGLVAVLTIALSNATMSMLDHGAPTTWALTANAVRGGVALLNVATRTGNDEARAADWQTWHSIWPTMLAFLIGGTIAAIAVGRLGGGAWLVPLGTSFVHTLFFWGEGQLPDRRCQ